MGGEAKGERGMRKKKLKKKKEQVYEISGVFMMVSNDMCMSHSHHCASFSNEDVHVGETPILFILKV